MTGSLFDSPALHEAQQKLNISLVNEITKLRTDLAELTGFVVKLVQRTGDVELMADFLVFLQNKIALEEQNRDSEQQ